MESVDVVILEGEDLDELEELASHYKPEDYPSFLEDLAEQLDQGQGNFCLGLEVETKLRAYLLAWLDESQVAESKEVVVWVEDIVQGTLGHQALAELIEGFLQQLRSQGYGHLALEACLNEGQESLLSETQELLERGGYDIIQRAELPDEGEGSKHWVRFEVLPDGEGIEEVDDYLDIEFSG